MPTCSLGYSFITAQQNTVGPWMGRANDASSVCLSGVRRGIDPFRGANCYALCDGRVRGPNARCARARVPTRSARMAPK